MQEIDFLKLKSGTDIRGTALGEKAELTDDVVSRTVKAFYFLLTEKQGKKPLTVAVGHDSRLSAQRLETATINALVESGANVLVCALTSTPAMFMMTRFKETDADAAIMLTASHHPSDKNGLKFFTKEGGLAGQEITTLLYYAKDSKCVTEDGGMVTKKNYLKLYTDHLIGLVRDWTKEEKPFSGMKIAVDAGNGSGGFYANDVLKALGADISGSQFLDADGRFPNHVPNPENALAMASISARVVQTKSDLGIIFDTDVDRGAIVDKSGKEINRNRLIALISAIELENNKGAYIVTDSVTSDGLKDFISESGGVHHRFKRGYKNVIDEAVRLNAEGKKAVLAIETSGHAAFAENYFLDDGAYLVTRILSYLSKQKKTPNQLIFSLSEAVEAREFRLTFKTERWKEYGDMIIKALTEFAQKHLDLACDNFEGVRANVVEAEGWFLARMSVHDPIMPINIESNTKGGVKRIAELLFAFLSAFSAIDATSLKNVK